MDKHRQALASIIKQGQVNALNVISVVDQDVMKKYRAKLVLLLEMGASFHEAKKELQTLFVSH